jgi:hypothetical protein
LRDLPDLIHFLLGAGVRIGESHRRAVALTSTSTQEDRDRRQHRPGQGKGLIRQVDESSKLTVRLLDPTEA